MLINIKALKKVYMILMRGAQIKLMMYKLSRMAFFKNKNDILRLKKGY